MMAEKIYINDDWQYGKIGDPKKTVRLPHTNIETPLSYYNDTIYQFESVYIKHIIPKAEWQNKCVFITFEGVAHIAKVYVNGKFISQHKGGYTAFTINLSDYLIIGEENQIKVEVDSRESCNIPPFGNVIDYLTYGGIYRDVYLEIKEKTHITDVSINAKDKVLNFAFETAGDVSNVSAICKIKKTTQTEWVQISNCKLASSQTQLECVVADGENWDIDYPVCYQLKIQLESAGEITEEKITTFGFRNSQFKKDGYYLNGKKVKLRGLNRHQSYPYVGYAMPKRPQQLDADILKFELGCNAVRTSHYPQSQHFLDRCDEIGLLVFTEITGWQHIGDKEWKETAIQTCEEMVKQYKHHPSIILWGSRINESQDDDVLYNKTNDVIRGLDPTRQTGGVRFIKNSNLLEDVYTYNDFSHTGSNAGLEDKNSVTSDKNAPYLVSEYNGHMFPTKSFDSEIHRLNHAKRHANVLQSLYAKQDIAGGFGWCMFDYNTHKDFGSGDRICHHGVMNMFRIPKLASSVYASQSEHADVLEISSAMDIGEHPGGNIEEVYAFTNADCVRLYKNDEYVKTFYPNKKEYGNMPHPPILIDDFIGELIEKHEKYSHKNAESIKSVLRAIVKYGQNNLPLKYKLKMAKVMLCEKLTLQDGVRLYSSYVANWGAQSTTYRFEGIKNNKVVSVCEKSATTQIALKVEADTQILKEETSYDVATVRIKIVNQKGETIPYYQGVINFEICGEGEIIGEKSVTAIGGGVATYVKTTGKKGSATLKISSNGTTPIKVEFQII